MRGLFVTATDTGVGKTEVACGLVRGHRARGLDVAAMKPAQSGHEPGEASDAERLRAAAGDLDPAELVCPYTFAAPLAPAVAARVEGKSVSLPRILEAARALGARHAALVVEGAGGLMTPLTDRETYADLAVALGLPVLVVARAGLGTVNHVALTCEALRARGLAVYGIVLNRASARADPSEPYNPAEIERLTGCRVLASLPFVPDAAERARRLSSDLAIKVQF
ncbi:dethiobiotin synthase [Anaeromyxobacter diazotrophicus]|uniref:ATP-dependent dethiobiotin synthetase BioD n=1 Tax=Anaeromyxobacter diazotrophicus TaxID=2590199 RepID=A0A7I9VN55_9BACT|nr:dethiobiotin synthase [Anaeromyxobacter diazotrophicus]GEJ57835.1 ATP-dependent dethiobiotin synthetase BioD [Anaeromyxobacter diazotrophicus]